MGNQVRRQFDVIDSQLEIPFQINGRIRNFADENIRPDAADVIDHLSLQQQIASG